MLTAPVERCPGTGPEGPEESGPDSGLSVYDIFTTVNTTTGEVA